MGVLQERGALVFEPRRFVELRKKPFWKQFLSSESTGMGIFYTLNVFCIQACPQQRFCMPGESDVVVIPLTPCCKDMVWHTGAPPCLAQPFAGK